MATRVLILGAGFGGLELATTLSEELGDEVEVTLIDKGDAFVFGYSKLDVLFGRTGAEAVRLPYADFAKPGVRLLKETVSEIDPGSRPGLTDAGEHEADVLVVALGADYDMDATPGLARGGQRVLLGGRRRTDGARWCRISSRAGRSSASAARRSSARRRRARPPSCSTTTWSRRASASAARSPS